MPLRRFISKLNIELDLTTDLTRPIFNRPG